MILQSSTLLLLDNTHHNCETIDSREGRTLPCINTVAYVHRQVSVVLDRSENIGEPSAEWLWQKRGAWSILVYTAGGWGRKRPLQTVGMQDRTWLHRQKKRRKEAV